MNTTDVLTIFQKLHKHLNAARDHLNEVRWLICNDAQAQTLSQRQKRYLDRTMSYLQNTFKDIDSARNRVSAAQQADQERGIYE